MSVFEPGSRQTGESTWVQPTTHVSRVVSGSTSQEISEGWYFVSNEEVVRIPTGSIRIPADISTVHSDGFLMRSEGDPLELVVYLTREVSNSSTEEPSAATMADAVVRLRVDFATLMRLSEGLRAISSNMTGGPSPRLN